MTKRGKLINEFQQQSAQKRDRNKVGNVIVLFWQPSYLFGKRQADNNYFFFKQFACLHFLLMCALSTNKIKIKVN